MILVNNRFEVAWEERMTVEDILTACGFTYPLVVVSVDGQVVPREMFATAQVADGDEVRVLHLVAGG